MVATIPGSAGVSRSVGKDGTIGPTTEDAGLVDADFGSAANSLRANSDSSNTLYRAGARRSRCFAGLDFAPRSRSSRNGRR